MTSARNVFIGHGGGPGFFLPSFDRHNAGPNSPYTKKLQKLCVTTHPKLLVVVTAHWECQERDTVYISSAKSHKLLFDYGGFPKEAYEYEYPAPGAPEVAKQAVPLLAKHNIKVLHDDKRGLDHGVFIPLMLMFPKADIPVLAISLNGKQDAEFHLRLGKALAPLVEQHNALLIASGSDIHGSMTVTQQDEFRAWVNEAVTTPDPHRREEMLLNYRRAPHFFSAHPGSADHFVPLLVSAGLSSCKQQGKVEIDEELFDFRTRCYSF
eukprot:TRINITY_DN102_c0_g2_i3.p1 TRINITY_DN102_c0_g2~~TRINITY_DN102_c0_g2_i3.p1  ORF type:complete len:266 (+),score=62.51 TRINITY_DN102_c0_g2_i3:50-847(+)